MRAKNFPLIALVISGLVLLAFTETARAQPASVNKAKPAPSIRNFPSELTAHATSATSIVLQWKPLSGATGLKIFRDGAVIASVSPATTSYIDNGLRPATIYSFYVIAFFPQSQAVPASSSVVRAQTSVALALTGNKATVLRRPILNPRPTLSQLDGHPPRHAESPQHRSKGAAPTDLDVEALSATSVRLTWRPVPGASYQVIRDRAKVLQQPTSATTYTDTGLRPASTHNYLVIAVYSDPKLMPGVSPVAVITTPDTAQSRIRVKVMPQSRRLTDRTILVAAFDSTTGIPLNGSVVVNGVTGRTGSSITYASCSQLAPSSSLVPASASKRSELGCHGTITVPGYPAASFDAPI